MLLRKIVKLIGSGIAWALFALILVVVGCIVLVSKANLPGEGGLSIPDTSLHAASYTVTPEACPAGGYDREAFGGFRKATSDAVKERAAGIDEWTHQPLEGSAQIDHVVPVREAACSALDPARYAEFYNDVRNLRYTDAGLNQAKSDNGPGEWLPASIDERCAFVAQWVGIKAAYHLTVDPDEDVRIRNEEALCP